MNEIEIRKKACLSNWFPLLENSGLPLPKTRIIKTNVRLIQMIDEETPRGFKEFIKELSAAAQEIGLPCFLRTGQTSNKHEWKDTCFLDAVEDLPKHVFKLVEFSECVDLLGLDYDVWVVREMLPTVPIFYHWNWLPITKERRYFVSGGKVVCHHPYWIRDAFNGLRHEQEKELAELNLESLSEIAELTRLAEIASARLPGAWSVDFLETKNGWYLIDAAPAILSWHYRRCKNQIEHL